MISLFTNLPVFIQSLKGPTFFLETQPSYTIGHIKSIIHEKLGIPHEKLKLRFADQLLEDRHMLSDCSIQDGSMIGRMDVRLQPMLYPLSFCPLQN